MTEVYKVIEARTEHLQSIHRLINEAYWRELETFFIDIPTSRERITLTELSKILLDDNQKLYVLVPEQNPEHILGVIAIEIPLDQEYVQFGLFAIDRHCSGRKLGRVLIEHIENYAKNLGRNIVKIDVLIFSTKLVNYYKRLDYCFNGNEKPFSHEGCIKPEFQNRKKNYLFEMEKTL